MSGRTEVLMATESREANRQKSVKRRRGALQQHRDAVDADSSDVEAMAAQVPNRIETSDDEEENLVGESTSSEDSDEEAAKNKRRKDTKVQELVCRSRGPKALLHDGNAEERDYELEEAGKHLDQLPTDYRWVSRLPRQKELPPWTPTAANSNSPDYSGRSLTSLFLEMSQKPLEHLLIGTNKLGWQLYPKSWCELTLHKLLVFIAIIFHMDTQQRRSLSIYWSKKNPDSFVTSSGISRRKFLKWFRALRPYDPDAYSSNEKRSNKIYKVEEYLRISQLQMQRMRKPHHRHFSLDEEMATFKGRCGLIQIIKNKPRGEGLKYYALCDPKTGYVFSTILHSGTKVEFDRAWGRIVAFCYKLLSGRPEGSGLANYLDQGFFVYTDRYYTTVQMNFGMSGRKTYFCGTLRREQRSSLPKEIMMGTRREPTSEEVKNMTRGDILRRYSNYGETAAISWLDNTVVTFLTSIDESTDEPQVTRRVKKSKKGRTFRLGVTQPAVAKQFSTYMGGVDIHDQLTTSVKAHHRSRRWYLSAVILQSLDWFAANAAILYNEFNENKVVNCAVKETVAERLLAFAKHRDATTTSDDNEEIFQATDCNPTPFLPPKLDDKEVSKLRRDKTLYHYPRKLVGKGRPCIGHCQRVTTNYFCMACRVFLCDMGCFARFHELEKYLFDDVQMNRPIVRRSQRY